MKITLWAGANKDRLKALTIGAARELIKKEFGADLPLSAIKNMYDACEIQSRGNIATKVPSAPSLQIRTLARILRTFMKDAGCTNIPPALDGLCAGATAEAEHHHVGNGAAK